MTQPITKIPQTLVQYFSFNNIWKPRAKMSTNKTYLSKYFTSTNRTQVQFIVHEERDIFSRRNAECYFPH
jgi:hypothetical protein